MTLTAAELRTRVQSHRKSLEPVERDRIRRALDLQFLQYLRSVIQPQPGQCWGAHRALPWEWSIPLSLQFLRESGVAIAYPRLRDPKSRTMGMAWHLADESSPEDWVSSLGMKTLLEPRADLPEIDPGHMAGVWVPGVAFSKRGERMGTGGGFYDTFLEVHPRLLRVALAADFQLFAELPEQRHDEPRMHVIVCEKTVLKFSGGN